jgi:hypothetical protein
MMLTTSNDLSEMRIVRKYPTLPWQWVWANLHTAGLSGTTKSTWNAAIHDILPDKRTIGSYQSRHHDNLLALRDN